MAPPLVGIVVQVESTIGTVNQAAPQASAFAVSPNVAKVPSVHDPSCVTSQLHVHAPSPMVGAVCTSCSVNAAGHASGPRS